MGRNHVPWILGYNIPQDLIKGCDTRNLHLFPTPKSYRGLGCMDLRSLKTAMWDLGFGWASQPVGTDDLLPLNIGAPVKGSQGHVETKHIKATKEYWS